jgi:hypothetical protein
VVRSGFFERHGWVMKEATIFSWEDVPTRTRVRVVHGNEVRVYSVTTEAEIMIHVQAKPHLLEYMDLHRVVLSDVLGGKDVVEGCDGRTDGPTRRIVIGRIRVKT